jgi:hypothetical protein
VSDERIILFVRADLRANEVQAFLQHLRNFDTTHEGCHLEISPDTPGLSITEILQMMQDDPELTLTKIYQREP